MSTAVLTVLNETHKGLIITLGYKANIITDTGQQVVIFLALGYFMGRGQLDPEPLAAMLIGYLLWYYAAIALTSMSGNLGSEATTGTLEQIYMSPSPSWVLFIGRALSTLMVSTIYVGIVAVVLIPVLDIHIPLDWEILPVFAITMTGLFGMGFAVGGATIVFKNVTAVLGTMQVILLLFNGTVLPIEYFPGWLETVSRAVPTTQGVIILRNITLEGQSLSAAWSSGDLPYLVLHSLAFLSVGWLIFLVGERVAKRQGTLGQY